MLSPAITRIIRRLKILASERQIALAIERIETARRPSGSRTRKNSHGLTVADYGFHNVLDIDRASKSQIAGAVIFKGSNNRVRVGAGCQATNLHIELGSDCRVLIDGNCRLSDLFVYAAQHSMAEIGQATTFEENVRLLLHEPGRIMIGKDCMFANHIDMTISDMHSIVSEFGVRVNPASDIMLEDHVWIGVRAMVLKGSRIGHGAIIGACSVVTGTITKKCAAAGVPARVVREGVTWRRELLPSSPEASLSLI